MSGDRQWDEGIIDVDYDVEERNAPQGGSAATFIVIVIFLAAVAGIAVIFMDTPGGGGIDYGPATTIPPASTVTTSSSTTTSVSTTTIPPVPKGCFDWCMRKTPSRWGVCMQKPVDCRNFQWTYEREGNDRCPRNIMGMDTVCCCGTNPAMLDMLDENTVPQKDDPELDAYLRYMAGMPPEGGAEKATPLKPQAVTSTQDVTTMTAAPPERAQDGNSPLPDITGPIPYDHSVVRQFTLKHWGKEHPFVLRLDKRVYDSFQFDKPHSYRKKGDLPPDWSERLSRQFVTDDMDIKAIDSIIEEIESLGLPDRDDEALIAIRFVQDLEYGIVRDEQMSYHVRYPYEVLFEMEGKCDEKTYLMYKLLARMGYGVAILDMSQQEHMALGIKCPPEDDYLDTGYCYIETTKYSPFWEPSIQEKRGIKNKLSDMQLGRPGMTFTSRARVLEEHKAQLAEKRLGKQPLTYWSKRISDLIEGLF